MEHKVTKAKGRRRGRPPSPDKAEKPGEFVGFRSPRELKAKLERAAHDAGRSISTEAQFRLEQSFETDELFAGPTTRAFAMLLAATVAEVEGKTGQSWLSDAATYKRALVAIYALLGRLSDAHKLRGLVLEGRRSLGLEVARASLKYAGYDDDAIARAFAVLKEMPAPGRPLLLHPDVVERNLEVDRVRRSNFGTFSKIAKST